MNEGIGSTVVIVIIVVFIVFASGYMAYNVNYTKAFRMKNKIISTYEKYDGVCTDDTGGCRDEIEAYAKEIGYNTAQFFNDTQFCSNNIHMPEAGSGMVVSAPEAIPDPGYCVYKIILEKPSDPDVINDKATQEPCYYRVVTVINIRVPIIENYLEFNYVTGDTKTFS